MVLLYVETSSSDCSALRLMGLDEVNPRVVSGVDAGTGVGTGAGDVTVVVGTTVVDTSVVGVNIVGVTVVGTDFVVVVVVGATFTDVSSNTNTDTNTSINTNTNTNTNTGTNTETTGTGRHTIAGSSTDLLSFGAFGRKRPIEHEEQTVSVVASPIDFVHSPTLQV